MTCVSQQSATSIRFEATIDASIIVRLPVEASGDLPSRGQVAVRGSMNGHDFRTVVEPDGMKGHWIRVDQQLRRAAGVAAGDVVDVAIEPTRDWPEPDVPADFARALAAAPQRIRSIWDDITPMARWEWVRWINATANSATRQRRVDTSLSKLDHGKRRPCCFDLSACTDPTVSRSGKLRGAATLNCTREQSVGTFARILNGVNGTVLLAAVPAVVTVGRVLAPCPRQRPD
jgi:hypothetical protein